MADDLQAKMKKVAIVANVAELVDVRLRDVEASRHASCDEIFDRVCSLSSKVDTSYDFDEEEIVLIAHVNATVTLFEATDDSDTPEPESDSRVFVTVRLSYDLDYALPSAPPEEKRAELFQAFSEVNGTYNSWPYIREAVQDLTTRMGFPPLVLPVHRVPRPDDNVAGSQPAPKLRVVGGGDPP